jgi:tripartite-type tricarboxylate transporter receptor subunit TctC
MNVIRLLGAWLGFAVLACGAAWAQEYPAKAVRVVIVFPPGGATDIVGRIVFQKMAEQLNQQFIIDNRAGASGTIGGALVAKSPPDGYTLMVYSATLIANQHLYKSLPYDALKDFIGLTPVARLVGVLVVHPSMPVRTMKDLIALAKARPNEISFGTAGIGAFQHLATSMLGSMAGIKLVHVPYKGGGPAAVATAAGEVQMMLTPISEVLPHVKTDRVRAIAVSSDKRTTQLPEIPTIAETVKGYDFISWMGTFAPAGTPKPIVDKLNVELKKAVENPDAAAKLSALVLDPMYMTVDDFARMLRAEHEKYGRIVKISGAKID